MKKMHFIKKENTKTQDIFMIVMNINAGIMNTNFNGNILSEDRPFNSTLK